MKGCFNLPIFNDRLKKLRQQQRWTMKELAEEINKFVDSPFSVSSVSNWENKGSEPPYNILCAIAKAFNVSSDYLIGLSDQETNTNIPSLQSNEDTQKEIQSTIKTDQIQQDIQVKVQHIQDQLGVLSPEKKELLDKELIEYLNFFDYKYNMLYKEFLSFTNYIQREIHAP